jgi:hypothetical protein
MFLYEKKENSTDGIDSKMKTLYLHPGTGDPHK